MRGCPKCGSFELTEIVRQDATEANIKCNKCSHIESANEWNIRYFEDLLQNEVNSLNEEKRNFAQIKKQLGIE